MQSASWVLASWNRVTDGTKSVNDFSLMSLDIDLVRFMSNRVRDGTKSKKKKKKNW